MDKFTLLNIVLYETFDYGRSGRDKESLDSNGQYSSRIKSLGLQSTLQFAINALTNPPAEGHSKAPGANWGSSSRLST